MSLLRIESTKVKETLGFMSDLSICLTVEVVTVCGGDVSSVSESVCPCVYSCERESVRERERETLFTEQTVLEMLLLLSVPLLPKITFQAWFDAWQQKTVLKGE